MNYRKIAEQIACSYCNVKCLPEEAEGILVLLTEEIKNYYESSSEGSSNLKSVKDLNSEVGFYKKSFSDIMNGFKSLLDPYRKLVSTGYGGIC